MSQLAIRESSEFSNTSFDSELSDFMTVNSKMYREIVSSKNKKDNRLIDIYMLGKAS